MIVTYQFLSSIMPTVAVTFSSYSLSKNVFTFIHVKNIYMKFIYPLFINKRNVCRTNITCGNKSAYITDNI